MLDPVPDPDQQVEQDEDRHRDELEHVEGDREDGGGAHSLSLAWLCLLVGPPIRCR